MISNSAFNAHNFIYCLAYQGPNETMVYYNDNDGHYHSLLYVIEGSMDVSISDTDTVEPSPLPKPEIGILYDIAHTRGKYVTSKTQSVGTSMITFNPVPADRKLNVEMLSGKQTVEVNAKDSRITIVCFTGPVNVNGKELKSTQYAVVFENKSATLTMEDNTICALVVG